MPDNTESIEQCEHHGNPTTCVICTYRMQQTMLAKQFKTEYTPEHTCLTTEPSSFTDKKSPSYYQQEGTDVYDFIIARYGLQHWLRHVEMEMLQYLLRAPLKGEYQSDIAKVKVICERILLECNKIGKDS